MREHYDKQNEEIDNQNQILKNAGKKDIIKPNIASSKTSSPDYIAKAPKK
jgi:hypothetical protein